MLHRLLLLLPAPPPFNRRLLPFDPRIRPDLRVRHLRAAVVKLLVILHETLRVQHLMMDVVMVDVGRRLRQHLRQRLQDVSRVAPDAALVVDLRRRDGRRRHLDLVLGQLQPVLGYYLDRHFEHFLQYFIHHWLDFFSRRDFRI